MSEYRFGPASLRNRVGVHPDLVRVMDRAIRFGVVDFSLDNGMRSQAEQDHFFATGASHVRRSKHQEQDDGWGHAIHAVPYPPEVNGVKVYDDEIRFAVLAGVILVAAKLEGVPVRWGGDWDGDGNNADSTLNDMAHWELV